MTLYPRNTSNRNGLRKAACAGLLFAISATVCERVAVAAGNETSSSPKTSISAPRRGQLALTVGLPIIGPEKVHGELGVDVRYGYKFWWLVPYAAFGFRQNRLDPLDWPWEARDRKLRAWHVTVGTRLEFPASRKLLPFLGISVERNWYEYTEYSTSYCHESWYPRDWRCYNGFDWKAGYGIKPQFGFLYVPEPSLALEFWVEYIHVRSQETFTRDVTFVYPSLGLAWHH